MNHILAVITLLGHTVAITGWKLVGYAGTLVFTARWFVQVAASRAHRQSHTPVSFWYMSLAGSFLLLAYFIWGRNDSVGIISNLFPSLVAAYNLHLVARHSKQGTMHGPGAVHGGG